jgi:hypothetical protein
LKDVAVKGFGESLAKLFVRAVVMLTFEVAGF